MEMFQNYNISPGFRDQSPWRKHQLWHVDSMASYPCWASQTSPSPSSTPKLPGFPNLIIAVFQLLAILIYLGLHCVCNPSIAQYLGLHCVCLIWIVQNCTCVCLVCIMFCLKGIRLRPLCKNQGLSFICLYGLSSDSWAPGKYCSRWPM